MPNLSCTANRGQETHDEPTFVVKPQRRNAPKLGNEPKPALVIEDVQIASTILRDHDFVCDRLTHNELMSGSGQHYHGKLRNGDYKLLWIATPGDWFVRTPGKRGGPIGKG